VDGQKKNIIEINVKEISSGRGVKVIQGATIIDGTGQPPISGVSVLIRDNVIERIGKTGSFEIPDGTEVMDGEGMTLLPGLIDSHFHYDLVKGLPALFLRHGITSVRDPGEWIETYEGERKSGDPLPDFS